MISPEAWKAIKENLTKETVEQNGGTWCGHFGWPMTAMEVAEADSVKTPKGQIRCETVIGKRIVIFTIPWDFRPDVRKEVECNPEYAERGAA